MVQNHGIILNVILQNAGGGYRTAEQIDIAILGIIGHVCNAPVIAGVLGHQVGPLEHLLSALQVVERRAVYPAVIVSHIDHAIGIGRRQNSAGGIDTIGGHLIGLCTGIITGCAVVPNGIGVNGHPAVSRTECHIRRRSAGRGIGEADELSGRVRIHVSGSDQVRGNGCGHATVTGNHKQTSGVGIHQSGDTGLHILIALRDIVGADRSLTGGRIQRVENSRLCLTVASVAGGGGVAHDVEHILVMIPGHMAGCLADDTGIAGLVRVDGIEVGEFAVFGNIFPLPGIQIAIFAGFVGTAVVDRIEVTRIVNGESGGVLIRAAGGVGADGGHREVQHHKVHAHLVLEEDAIGREEIQIAIGIVQRHVIDDAHIVLPTDQSGGVVDVIHRSRVQIAVVAGKNHLSSDQFGRIHCANVVVIAGHGQSRGTGVGVTGLAVHIEPQGIGVDHQPAVSVTKSHLQRGHTIFLVANPGEHLAIGIEGFFFLLVDGISTDQIGDAGKCTQFAQPEIAGNQLNKIQLGICAAGVSHQQTLIDAVVNVGHGSPLRIVKNLADIAYLLVEVVCIAPLSVGIIQLGIDDDPVQVAIIFQNEIFITIVPVVAGFFGHGNGHSTTHLRSQVKCGDIAVGVIGHQQDIPAGRQAHKEIALHIVLGVVVTVGAVGQQGRRGCTIQTGIVGGIPGALTCGIAVGRVDFIHIAAIEVVTRQTIDLAFVVTATNERHRRFALPGDGHIGGIDFRPVGVALSISDLRAEHHLGFLQGEGIDLDGRGGRFALFVDGNGIDLQFGRADTGYTDDTFIGHGGDPVIVGAPLHILRVGDGQNGRFDLMGLIGIQFQLGDIGANGQRFGPIPQIQAVDQFHIFRESSQLCGHTAGGVDGVELSLFAGGGFGDQNITIVFVINGGDISTGTHGGHTA